MSRKKPVTVKIEGEIYIETEGAYHSEVVPSGNGAVIKFFKRYIGAEVIVLLEDKIKNKEKTVGDLTEEAYLHQS